MTRRVANVKATRHDFHVPLTEALYELLRNEADQPAEPATEIAGQTTLEHKEVEGGIKAAIDLSWAPPSMC